MYKIKHCVIMFICFSIILVYFFGVNISFVEGSSNNTWDDTAARNVNKVVLIVADYIELEDFQRCSFIYKMIQKGNVALMNNRQAGKQSAIKSKLNIGTGSKLEITSKLLNLAYDFDSGKINSRISYLDINELKQFNAESEYNSRIGYIGDQLNLYNMQVCLISNSDAIYQYNRGSALIAMDSSGNIDMGNIDYFLKYSSSFPDNKITDFTRLEELYKHFLPASSFLVIEIDDFVRLEENKSNFDENKVTEAKLQALSELDKFAKNIYMQDNTNITFIILSSYPSKDNIKKGSKLTPIVIYDNNVISQHLYSGGGMLHSVSTRRNGIIINTDLTDFILERLGIPIKSNISKVNKTKAYEKLIMDNQDIIRVSKLRLPVLTSYAMYEIISAILALIYLVAMKAIKNKGLDYVCRIILLSNMAAPIVLLFMSYTKIQDVALYIIAFFAGIYFVSLTVKMVTKNRKASNNIIASFALITFIQVLSTIIDTMTNGTLIKHSVLGYDPIIGARFYGIGNEFAGVYIGVSILFICSLLELLGKRISISAKKTVLLLYFIFCTLIISMPFWGANFGATIAAITGYFFAYIYINKIKINKKSILTFVLIITLLIIGIVIIDTVNREQSSHIGRFVSDIGKNGINVLFSTIKRKLSMNLKLIKSTIWTKVLISLLLIILIMFFRPVKIINIIFSKYKKLTAAWIGISAAGVMGLFVNDSGIVMAATAMIYICYPMLMICIDEMNIFINKHK